LLEFSFKSPLDRILVVFRSVIIAAGITFLCAKDKISGEWALGALTVIAGVPWFTIIKDLRKDNQETSKQETGK